MPKPKETLAIVKQFPTGQKVFLAEAPNELIKQVEHKLLEKLGKSPLHSKKKVKEALGEAWKEIIAKAKRTPYRS